MFLVFIFLQVRTIGFLLWQLITQGYASDFYAFDHRFNFDREAMMVRNCVMYQ
jgi:hypothetical protein